MQLRFINQYQNIGKVIAKKGIVNFSPLIIEYRRCFCGCGANTFFLIILGLGFDITWGKIAGIEISNVKGVVNKSVIEK